MPVKRDKDGNVIEVPTRLTEQGGAEHGRRTVDIAGSGGATRVHRGGDPHWDEGADTTVRGASVHPAGVGSGYGAPTKPMESTQAPDAGATVVHRPESPGAMSDPPVGWLVVVAGPGKGEVATLGLGVNTIGRDSAVNRVPIDHGDDMISRTNHGAIVYDDHNRQFWIRHGDGTNLTYVDDEPVLEARRLDPLTHIRMGNTVLRFVPLCGESFAWSDDEPESG